MGRDLKAGTWGNYDWFNVDDGNDYALDIGLRFIGPDGEGRDYITIFVSPDMTETVACLRQLGLVTDADLVTRRNLYPEDYAQSSDSYEDGAYDRPSAGETVEVYDVSGTVAVSPA